MLLHTESSRGYLIDDRHLLSFIFYIIKMRRRQRITPPRLDAYLSSPAPTYATHFGLASACQSFGRALRRMLGWPHSRAYFDAPIEARELLSIERSFRAAVCAIFAHFAGAAYRYQQL